MCVGRAARLQRGLAVFGDQGDSGLGHAADEEGVSAAAAGWDLCSRHQQVVEFARETESKLPQDSLVAPLADQLLCGSCVKELPPGVSVRPAETALQAARAAHAGQSAAATAEIAALADLKQSPESYANAVREWGAQETARIGAWEEREVKAVHAAAAETVQLVREVCEQRQAVGASLLAQRLGLRVTLEELESELAGLPWEGGLAQGAGGEGEGQAADLRRRTATLLRLAGEREQLLGLLRRGGLRLAPASEVTAWATLPQLDALSPETGPANAAAAAAPTVPAAAAAARALRRLQTVSPVQAVPDKFPFLPPVVRIRMVGGVPLCLKRSGCHARTVPLIYRF